MAVRGGRCLGGGACCKFDLTGRLVYVTTAELAFLLAAAPADPARALRRRCPYQIGPRCTARPRRPLGCRTFFCDPVLADASGEVYERAHRRLRALHERLSLPYRYEELTGALGRLLAPARAGQGDAPQTGAASSFLR